MAELSKVDFVKEGGLTKILFEYSEPFARKTYYPLDEYNCKLLDIVLEVKDIFNKYPEIEKGENRLLGLIFKEQYNRYNYTEGSQISEYFSYSPDTMECIFDLKNLINKNKIYACFSVVPPHKNYSGVVALYIDERYTLDYMIEMEYLEELIETDIISTSPK